MWIYLHCLGFITILYFGNYGKLINKIFFKGTKVCNVLKFGKCMKITFTVAIGVQGQMVGICP